ncbi:2,3-bisphosphoglycerate-independent phosphoglycerate mutase [Chlamydiota bacterium]
MKHMELLSQLSIKTDSKIIFLVIDGIGGLQHHRTNQTELEQAKTPHLDALAKKALCGFSIPVTVGITPGSGPGHLGIFGYNPTEHEIGRGALSAAGVGFEQTNEDLAARINFATIDNGGILTDRRAGRIPTEVCEKLCKKLSEIPIKGVKLFVIPEKEHRAVVIFRAKGFLSDELTDSDPQQVGVAPLSVLAKTTYAQKTAEIVNLFINEAKKMLRNDEPANMVLLRGFSVHPEIPKLQELYNLKPAAIATYPMYKGVARLVGMEILKTGTTIRDEFETLKEQYQEYTYFYVHIKATDSRGEDGAYFEKAKVIEEVDRCIPLLMRLNPDVVVVTGDHSTPAVLKSHSWHPVPTMVYSPYCRFDQCDEYSEKAFTCGGLGHIEAQHLLGLALANALKLRKYGA